MIQTHYSQITPHPTTQIDTTGAVSGNAVVFNGTSYVPLFPVVAYDEGVLLGRVNEINVTGAGATASITGSRMNIAIPNGGLTGTNGNGLTVTPTTVVLAQATTASGGAMPSYPTSNASFLFLRGDGLWAVPPGSGGGGGGTMNSWRAQTVNTFGGVVTSDDILNNYVAQFQAGTGIDITQTVLGGGSRFTIGLAAGAGYTHPAYTPRNFMPSLAGNVLTVPAIVSDAIGSITSITAQSFTLPSGGGGSLTGNSGNGLTVTANTVTLALANTSSAGAMPTLPNNSSLFLNGVGAWATPPSGGGGAVTSVTSGNPTALTVTPTTGNVVITPNGQSTTLGSAWNSTTRILSIPVGTYQGGILTSSILNQFDLTVAASANTIEVRYNDVTVNPAAAIINFKGPGVTSVTNGIGTEITISGGSGGVTSFNGNTGAINLISGTNTTVVPVAVGVFRIDATGGGGGGLVGTSGNGLTVGTNSVSLAIATTSTAGACPVLSGLSTQHLTGAGTWVNTPLGLPSGTIGQTLYSNGSTWVASSALYNNPATISAGIEIAGAGGQAKINAIDGLNNSFFLAQPTSAYIFSSGSAFFTAQSAEINTQQPSGFVNIGRCSPSGFVPAMITIQNGLDLLNAKMGFFGNTAITRPSTTNDITSVRNALIALGLIS